MSARKKRVGFVSSSPLVKTGFSGHSFRLLKYLFNLKKYELFFLHQGVVKTPDLDRYPWHNFPAITDEVAQSEKFRSGEDQFRRVASYGNFAVEKFVVDNKLDVVFHIEDPWSSLPDFYFKKDWFQHIKQNFVNWITADSLPILQLIKDWVVNCPNVWFWSSFAEKALKEEDAEKYKTCRTVAGAADVETFQPLSPNEKSALRQRFGIKDNELLILHLGRNQLRKLFFSNIEALAKFKARNPELKAKLLLHCSWSEPQGWKLDDTRKEFGLAKEDVLATYYCMQCREWEIKPFDGEFLDCSSCHVKGEKPNDTHKHGRGCVTAGIGSTITEQDLAKIYGMCDAASSPFTSGGLEYFNVESLLCGLPLITTPYSCGEDFAEQPFVTSMQGSFTREVNSNFLKFVPNPNSITNFFTKIAKMSPQKRAEISRAGREWAQKKFDIQNIGKVVEEFIDSRELIDWEKYHEYKKEYDVKNPDAQIPSDIENNAQYIKTLYKNILKMDVQDDDSGLLDWLQKLENGAKRDQIEQIFRDIASQENQNKNPLNIQSFLDDTGRKRGLILVKESGGDIFISTALFRSFKEQYPHHDLYFSCDTKFKEIIAGNPYVYKYIPWHVSLENELMTMGAGKEEKGAFFDVVIYPAVCSQKFLNYLSNTNALKIN